MNSVLTLKSPLFQYSLYMLLQQIQMCHLRKVVARSGPSSPSSYAKWFWIRILYIIIYWVQNLYKWVQSQLLCTGPGSDSMYWSTSGFYVRSKSGCYAPSPCECIFLPHNIYSYQKEYYNNKHSSQNIM